MKDFEYLAPVNLEQAVTILQDDLQASILCGGTDLIVQLREGHREISRLVDIKKIPQLQEVSYNNTNGLIFGAGVPCFQLCRDPFLKEHYPGLVDAFSLIGGVQIQGRASVGGNLCNASPAADSIPALIVHQAACRVYGPDGWRDIPAEDFCLAPGKNCLKAGEILVSIHVPPPAPHFGAHYLRFTPRNEMDIAVVGAGASVKLDDTGETILVARLALAAVAPTPLFLGEISQWLAGKSVSETVFEEASWMVKDYIHPIDDLRGTVKQRQRLSIILTRRALRKAIARAKGETQNG
jgi:xanthine dehydrogenase FAD-binding subunit